MQGRYFKAYGKIYHETKITNSHFFQAKSKYLSYIKDIEGCDRWSTEYKDEIDNSLKKYQSFIDKVNRKGGLM